MRLLKRETDRGGSINKREVGRKYEEMAVSYLRAKGYVILERNYLRRVGEIDILARSNTGYVVAVEVKYRSSNKYGGPLSAVSYEKQRKIAHTLMVYIKEKLLNQDTPFRFDVVGIYGDGSIKHIENAFEIDFY